MTKDYAKTMVFKPDYRVYYIERTGLYAGLPKDQNVYNEMVINGRPRILYGYAASKSHPDTPVKIAVMFSGFSDFGPLDLEIEVYKINSITGMEPYTGKHDLFLYKDERTAKYAGTEMMAIDAVGDVYNSGKNGLKNIFDKFSEVIDSAHQAHEHYKRARNFVDTAIDCINRGKEIVAEYMPTKEELESWKDTLAKQFEAANEAYKYFKEDIKDEYLKAQKSNKEENLNPMQKDEHFTRPQHGSTLYYTTADGWYHFVLSELYHTLTVYKRGVCDENNRGYQNYFLEIEKYNALYKVFTTEYLNDRQKFNDIMDILGNDIYDSAAPTPSETTTGIKRNTAIEVENNPEPKTKKNKRKFETGDYVIDKKTNSIGEVECIYGQIMRNGKIRNRYIVKNCATAEYKEYYSWELDPATAAVKAGDLVGTDKLLTKVDISDSCISVSSELFDMTETLDSKLQDVVERLEKLENLVNKKHSKKK